MREDLSGIALFRSTPGTVVSALAKRCRWQRYTAHQLIVGHQDQTRDVFFIVHGRVRVTTCSVTGEEVAFRDLDAGETFGELSAIDGKPRSANVVALEETLVAAMPAGAFWDVLTTYPTVAAATLRHLSHLVRALSERVYEFSTLAVRNRIHAELLRLAQANLRNGNRAVIEPGPTHAALASRISTHREAVTRELNNLARDGLLERKGRTLVIHDVDRLARLVHEVSGESS
jgi:CRP-like cAMP-binding protein